MLTTISYSESDIVALREMAELQYHTAYEKTVNEAVTVDESDYNFDEIFMENCVYAGYSMDEAVDAAMQKHKLLNSQEMKLVKRLASQTRKAVKKGDYETALSLAKKRLAHLENMVKRAEDIDDDEQFIIAAETLVKSYIVTIIATHLIIAIVNGLLPGSGPIVSMIKKALNAFKLTDIKQQLAGKGFMTVVEKIAAKYITISGTAKLTGSYIGAHKQRKWANTRAGDVNREVNAGRPDTTHMSVSRTEAKVKLNKLIKAQQEEIKTLEANVKAKPTNESAEVLDEGLLKKFGGYIKAEQEKERARLEKERVKHADEYDAAYQKQRLANRKATDRERQEIKNAVAIKNGNYSVELPPFSALAAAGVPISDVEAYLSKNAKKQPEEIKAFLTDLDLNLEYADLDEETSKIAAENQKKVTRELNRHLNDDIYVIFSSKYTIQMYCAKERSVYVAYADINAGRYPGDGISVDKYNSLKDYLMQDRYSGYSNMKSDDVSFYKRLLKNSVNESTEVLDEGIIDGLKKHIEKRLAKAHSTSSNSSYGKALRNIKTALNIKNGKPDTRDPSLYALAYVQCPVDVLEKYFQERAAKHEPIFKNFLDRLKEEVSDSIDENPKSAEKLNDSRKTIESFINDAINHRVFFYIEYFPSIDYYDAQTRKYVTIDYLEGDAYIEMHSVGEILRNYQESYNKHKNSDEFKYYPKALQAIKRGLLESVEALDEGILGTFGASKYAKQFAGLLKTAQAVKNGTANGQIPSLEALSYIKCDPKIIENYFRKIAKKDPKIFDDFMSYVSNELDEDDERISVLKRKLMPHKNNPIVNLYANHPVKSEIFFYDASDNMIYQVSEDDDFDFNRTSVSTQLKESYPDIFEKDYKKAMKIAEIKESAEILDEKFFGRHKAKKNADHPATNDRGMNHAKQDIRTALSIKSGKDIKAIPNLYALAFVKCSPDVLEKYMQANAAKNSRIIENHINKMNDYIDGYWEHGDDKETEPDKYTEVKKAQKSVEEYLRKAINHRLFFFTDRSHQGTTLYYYDADIKKWVEATYLDSEIEINECSVTDLLKEYEKYLQSSDMQKTVSMYRKALRDMKTELSESANVLDEKFFRSPMLDMIKKRKEKKAKLAADRDAAWKRAKTEVSVALSVKNGKMPDTTPHPAALAFVKCPPDIVEKYAQAKAKKNPKVIEDQIDGMNEYIEMYYDDNDTKEYEPEEYAKLEKERKYVEDYLKKAMTHRVFFFDTYSDRVSPLCYYDADTKTWVETGYYEAEAYANEFYLSEMLKEEEKALRESFMQDRVSLYRRALQSLKNQLSESVGVLDEKFFKHSSGSTAKKPKKKKVKQVAISEQDRKNANKDIRAALDIKNGKSTKYVPNMYALAFVQCTPETLEKHMQSNATKNPRAIQNQINRMNAYLKTYYSDNNIKEDDPETYKNLEDDRNYVESYLKDAVNHRLFFFDTEPDPDYSFGFYDVDSRKWIETGYNDGEIFLNELSVAEILEICNRMLKEGFMQAKVAVYKKALQSIKSELSESITLNEAKLKAAERNELPDSAFGIPSKRKFPLNDPAHVKAAVKMFRHASPADRPELARRIKRAIKKFNLDIEIGEDNPLHEYK